MNKKKPDVKLRRMSLHATAMMTSVGIRSADTLTPTRVRMTISDATREQSSMAVPIKGWEGKEGGVR